ncbi:MAG: GNAT family N-acetyltransferase [Ruegeria sp.]
MTDMIITERLVLRRPQMGDAAVVARIMNDLDVSRWLTRAPFPYTRKDAIDFIRRRNQRSGNAFLVWLNSQLVGCVGTERELGYWIGHDHWGKGIATEAADAVIKRYFSRSNTRLKSGYFVENKASRQVLRKLGFVSGLLERTKCPATGKRHFLRRMYLTRADWEAAQ